MHKTVHHADLCLSKYIRILSVVFIIFSSFLSASESLDDLLNEADKALYSAKNAGRNQVSFNQKI